jgi:hypothetical protein
MRQTQDETKELSDNKANRSWIDILKVDNDNKKAEHLCSA